jgi:hypothetical protein
MLWQAFGRWGAFAGVQTGGGVTPIYGDDEFYDLNTDAGGGSDLVITYPAGPQSNDIAFIHVVTAEGQGIGHNIECPSGWTEAHEGTYRDNFRHALFWKRLTGSESGTVTITITGGSTSFTVAGTITYWRGCVASGTPYEGLANAGGENGTVVSSAITTTGPNRRVLCFTNTDELNNPTPGSGWSQQFAYNTDQGPEAGCTVQCLQREQASAGSIGAGSHSVDSARWGSITLALLPLA